MHEKVVSTGSTRNCLHALSVGRQILQKCQPASFPDSMLRQISPPAYVKRVKFMSKKLELISRKYNESFDLNNPKLSQKAARLRRDGSPDSNFLTPASNSISHLFIDARKSKAVQNSIPGGKPEDVERSPADKLSSSNSPKIKAQGSLPLGTLSIYKIIREANFEAVG